MTGLNEKMYWRTNRNWFKYNSKTDDFYLTDDASDRAKRSFDLWKGQSSDGMISTNQIVYFSMANSPL